MQDPLIINHAKHDTFEVQHVDHTSGTLSRYEDGYGNKGDDITVHLRDKDEPIEWRIGDHSSEGWGVVKTTLRGPLGLLDLAIFSHNADSLRSLAAAAANMADLMDPQVPDDEDCPF